MVNKLYKETPLDAPEGKYIADLRKSAKKIRDAFLEGAVEAGKKANAKTTEKTTANEVKSQARVTSEQDATYLEAVTYDDNGNVIPLSERFNEKSKDIRYKARGGETKRLLLLLMLQVAILKALKTTSISSI